MMSRRPPPVILSLDPARLFEAAGHRPDPWQRELLRSTHPRILLNCCRQAGKSTTVAALALHQALYRPGSLVLLLSRALRQSVELFRKVTDFHVALGQPVRAVAASTLRLELANGSRVVSLPGKESTIRGYSGVKLLVIDEAARVPVELYRSVRPMLAVSRGRLICLSTPFGRQGFFWQAWEEGGERWQRFRVTADQCPRMSPAFLEEERQTLGDTWYRQEYECSFAALEGLVYPDFSTCVVDEAPELEGRKVGGIDFGFRNPFAAVWGGVDRDDVLWLTGERYKAQCPLSEHAAHLPREVYWEADPAGRTEIEELRRAGFRVQKGDNAIAAGIAAVTGRIRSGRLKVLRSGCPRLIAEAGLYRYPRADERALPDENPVDDNNHALAALRYLVSRLDAHFLARAKGRAPGPNLPLRQDDSSSPSMKRYT